MTGYTGEILRVQLSEGKISVEKPEAEFYRRYWGGAGFIAYYLLREMEPGIDPLHPGNKLIFAPGPLTGLPLPGSGRNCVGAKSPLTSGFGKSEVGGYWGIELKRAGFDALIIEGKAEKPVYLSIHDQQIEIKSAEHLWGLTTGETQEAIRSELEDNQIQIAQIGPGGEKLVRFAAIMAGLNHAAGRTGMGAVMGSKNLKGIAVRGHLAPKAANPTAIRDLARFMADNYKVLARPYHEYGTGGGLSAGVATGNVPIRNYGDGEFDGIDEIGAERIRDTIRVAMEGCYACPVRCKKVVRVDTPYIVDPAYGGPEYETIAALGSNCGIKDLKAIAKANELCGRYSLDTISTGGTIAFAMECFENGILTLKDSGGIELRFGNAAAMLQIIVMIGRREGIGDLLAEGSARVARKLGREAEQFAIHVKGLEVPMHEPRLKQGMGLIYALCAHGADHCDGIHDTGYTREGHNIRGLRALGIMDPLPADDLGPAKVAMARTIHLWNLLLDCLVMCVFVPWEYGQVAEMVRAATGWNTTVAEAMKVGERVATMSRAFNLREGLTAAADYLPRRFLSPTPRGALQATAIAPDTLTRAIQDFYRAMGWTGDTGTPTADKLAELGISWVGES